jgi:hypothetical protein
VSLYRAVRSNGVEGWLRPGTPFNYRLPTKKGWIAYDNTLTWLASLTYAEARPGVPRFIAPSCSTVLLNYDEIIWVESDGSVQMLDGRIRVLARQPASLLVQAQPDTVSPGGTSKVTALAVGGDGKEASLAANTSVTFTVSDASLGLLRVGTGTPASAVTVSYGTARSSGVTFVADTTAPCEEELVTVRATAGSYSGETLLTVLGDALPDTLIVSATPDSLAEDQTSQISVTALNKLGCEISEEVWDETLMTISAGPPSNGQLEYAGIQGLFFPGVPYEDVKNGMVTFVTGPVAPSSKQIVTIEVASGELSGNSKITIRCKTGVPYLDDPGIRAALASLWLDSYGSDSNPKPQSERREMAGWIIQTSSGYQFQPIEPDSSSECRFEYMEPVPPGAIARMHTHPFTHGEIITTPLCSGKYLSMASEDDWRHKKVGIDEFYVDRTTIGRYNRTFYPSGQLWIDRCGY